ncbi:hypothetical protein [Erythrobacter sp. MTPC3]|uniref:hypothetical protein n=1 Tax=Erythrobacter sp. MTPC3 TaxID=3056564 RepID=UPI0036F1A400
MITAILSARKMTADGGLRAGLKMGGRSVLAWQTQVMRSLGCERFICLCDSLPKEVADVQLSIEASGHEFHAVRSSLQFVSLLRADDVAVVMLDGLMPQEAVCHDMLVGKTGLRRAILTIPADHPLAEAHPEDFERIDAQRNWGGIAVMRAVHAQKLAEMPPDVEIMSLLLRLGLQARCDTVPVPADALTNGDWLLANSERAIASRQSALIARNAAAAPIIAPLDAIAAKVATMLAPKGMSQDYALIAGLSALTLFAGGAIFAWFGYAIAALFTGAVAALLASFAISWKELKSALLGEGRDERNTIIIRYILAAIATVLLTLSLMAYGQNSAVLALAPLLSGLALLAGTGRRSRLAAFWGDTAFHLAILGVCAAFGLLAEGMAVLALGAMSALMLRSFRN